MPEELWFTGEGRAVDAAVLRNGKILLIRRTDGTGWALPGGFVDLDESDADAMRRELYEETGVLTRAEPVMAGERIPVDDPRNTAEAWITTRVGVFFCPANQSPPLVRAADDAADTRWVNIHGQFGYALPPQQIDRNLREETGFGLYSAHWPLLKLVTDVDLSAANVEWINTQAESWYVRLRYDRPVADIESASDFVPRPGVAIYTTTTTTLDMKVNAANAADAFAAALPHAHRYAREVLDGAFPDHLEVLDAEDADAKALEEAKAGRTRIAAAG